LEATKNADFDVAILDANLNGEPALPVADAVVARGTPFVFATGYGELPKPYRDRPTLRKPFQIDGLKGMLQSTLHNASQQYQSHSTGHPAASSVPRWLTICLQWLLFQQMHYHGSESRVMPLRGIELF
jgi:hypothetical protein